MSVKIQIGGAALAAMDRELAGLKLVSRMPAIKKGIRAGCKIVQKRLVATLPKPGYPGDKPGLKPLRDATAVKVKEYPDGAVLGLVGFDYTGGGQHGHLVEEGHRIAVGGKLQRVGAMNPSRTSTGNIGGFVPGGHYLAHAAEATQSEQESAMTHAMETAIEEAKKQ